MEIKNNNETDRAVYRVLCGLSDKKPPVKRYYNSDKTKTIDLAVFEDIPQGCGLTTVSTIGLYKTETGFSNNDRPLRAELAGVCDSRDTESCCRALSAAAFEITDRPGCHPGAVIFNAVKNNYPPCTMKHFLLDSASSSDIWHERITKKGDVIIGGRQIVWLTPIPISHEEYLYMVKHGNDHNALIEIFRREDVDIADVYRKSVV